MTLMNQGFYYDSLRVVMPSVVETTGRYTWWLPITYTMARIIHGVVVVGVFLSGSSSL